MSPAAVHLSRPQASTTSGEADTHVQERESTRDLHRALRDQAVPLLRALGPGFHPSRTIARQLDVSPSLMGKVFNLFGAYFETHIDVHDGLFVALHRHLVAP